MATNSKAELLNWLKEPGRLQGYDMVFAIDKAKADALLTQEYIRRFKTTSYLPPVNGETPPELGHKVYMKNFVLDHPRLSFDNVDITSSKASLRMRLVGGNQVNLKRAGAHWYPQRMDSIDPLVGPELILKLELGAVPGYVDDDGRIMLDLRNSDNFVLTFSDSNRLRELGGNVFKELFRALPVEKRVWSLGTIERGPDELLQPESFRLRTQRNPSASFAPAAGGDQPDVDGALIGQVRMVGNNGEQLVVSEPNYRYLIPAGDDEYSATVLLGNMRVFFAAVRRQLEIAGLDGAQFSIEISKDAVTATATAGHFVSAGGGRLHYQEFGVLPGYSKVLAVTTYASVESLSVSVDAGRQPLSVVVRPNGVDLSMDCTFSVRFKVHEVNESYGVVGVADFEGDYITSFVFGLEASWEAAGASGAELRLRSHKIGLDVWGGIEGPLSDKQSVRLGSVLSPSAVTEKIRDAIRYAGYGLVIERLEPKFREALVRDLAVSIRLDEVVEDIVKLNFGEALKVQDHHLPNDVACFGHINQRLTTFTVTPLESTITHNSKLQFATVPAQANVTWSAESVEGSSDAPGEFSKTVKGEYLAPPASGIHGAFTRVRITATDPSTGYSASALVSVVKNALSLSPLVEVCQVSDECDEEDECDKSDEGVSLMAGHVGLGELSWKVLGAAPHGRLAHTEGQANTYIPGGNIPGKAYVVEQVEVRNSLTNEHRTLCLITTMTTKIPYDMVVAKREGQRLWLQLFVDDLPGITDLEVVHGPGKVARDAEGEPYYEADAASQAPFCVVGGVLKEGRFSFEGFIVLPLPLDEHTAVYQQLDQAAQ